MSSGNAFISPFLFGNIRFLCNVLIHEDKVADASA